MAYGLGTKTVVISSALALAAIVILSGILSACAKAPTTTSAPVQTKTASAPASTTTSAPKSPTTTASTTAGVSAADFYRNNVATIVVPYGPGGSTDLAARLFANYWTEVTGGRMVVQNKEGGGGISGANYVYAAKPDGLTLGEAIPGAGLIGPTLVHDPAAKFDIKKMTWIGFTNPDSSALVISAKSTYASMEDISKVKGFKFGASSRTGSGCLGSALVSELFGLQDARIVLGYSGTTEAILAVAKGEVDGYVSTALSDSVKKGLVKPPLLTLNFERSPYFPDTPTIPELLKLSPEQENLLKTLAALVGGQVIWFPPGVPQDRIDFVRNAFDKMVVNEDFLKQARTLFPVWVTPTGGKAYAAQMERNLAVVTPERYDALQKLADKYLR